MGIKIGKLDVGNEILNSKVNIDTLLNILVKKGYITEEEFNELRKKIIKEHYSEYIINKDKKDTKEDKKNKE